MSAAPALRTAAALALLDAACAAAGQRGLPLVGPSDADSRAWQRSSAISSNAFGSLVPQTQCRVRCRRYGNDLCSTNQTCSFRESHRPTHRQSDQFAILE